MDICIRKQIKGEVPLLGQNRKDCMLRAMQARDTGPAGSCNIPPRSAHTSQQPHETLNGSVLWKDHGSLCLWEPWTNVHAH